MSPSAIRAILAEHADLDIGGLLAAAAPVERLWRDLSPSEAARLDELVDEAIEELETEIRALILDRLTAAVIRFAP